MEYDTYVEGERRIDAPAQDDRPMELRIADTFTDSLARLTGDEQKAAKTSALALQINRG